MGWIATTALAIAAYAVGFGLSKWPAAQITPSQPPLGAQPVGAFHFAKALEAFPEHPETLHEEVRCLILLQHWIERDPDAAMAHLHRDHPLYGWAWKYWTAHDPTAAMEAYQALDDPLPFLKHTMLTHLAEADPNAFLGLLLDNKVTWDIHYLKTQAMERLADTDLRRAREIFDQANGTLRTHLLVGLAESWARQDPNAMLLWAKSLEDDERLEAFHQLLNVTALTNAPKAAKLYESLTENLPQIPPKASAPNRGDARIAISRRLAEHDVHEALAFVERWGTRSETSRTRRDEIRDVMLSGIALALPYQDAKAIHATFAKLRDSPHYETLLRRLPWSETDHAELVTSLLTTDEGPVRHDLIAQALSLWARSDLQGVQAFLQEHPNQERDWHQKALLSIERHTDPDAVKSFVTALEIDTLPESFLSGFGQAHPNLTAELLESLAESPARQEAYQQHAVTMAHTDADEALSWLDALPEHDRLAATAGITEGWVSYDPFATSQWLGNLTPGPERDAGVAVLAEHLTADDPEAAFAWATSIADKQGRLQTLTSIVTTWAQSDPEHARAWIDTSELSPAEKRFLHATAP